MHQQIIEINRVGFDEPLLIFRIDPRDNGFQMVAHAFLKPGFERLGVISSFFTWLICQPILFGGKCVASMSSSCSTSFKQAVLIGCVEDRKIRAQSHRFAALPQQSRAELVERGDPQAATGVNKRSTRSAISRAALLVNVIARISHGDTPRSTSRAIRGVMTRVFPDPARQAPGAAPESAPPPPLTRRQIIRCHSLRTPFRP